MPQLQPEGAAQRHHGDARCAIDEDGGASQLRGTPVLARPQVPQKGGPTAVERSIRLHRPAQKDGGSNHPHALGISGHVAAGVPRPARAFAQPAAASERTSRREALGHFAAFAGATLALAAQHAAARMIDLAGWQNAEAARARTRLSPLAATGQSADETDRGDGKLAIALGRFDGPQGGAEARGHRHAVGSLAARRGRACGHGGIFRLEKGKQSGYNVQRKKPQEEGLREGGRSEQTTALVFLRADTKVAAL